MCLLLMVVHDFDFGWSGASVRPPETDSPLVVYADAPPPLTSALQRFEAVAGPRQIAEAGGGIELVELARGGSGEAGERRDPATPVECLGLPVPEADNHDVFRSLGNRAMSTVAETSAVSRPQDSDPIPKQKQARPSKPPILALPPRALARSERSEYSLR